MALEPWAEQALTFARLQVETMGEVAVRLSIESAWDVVNTTDDVEKASSMQLWAELLQLLIDGVDPIPYLEARNAEIAEPQYLAADLFVVETEMMLLIQPPSGDGTETD